MKENKKSRAYNVMTNSLVGMISAVLNVLMNFGVRVVIVHTLGEEINGLHNLFQSLLSVLAVVETSLLTAMIIHLYEPVKHRNTALISDLMSLYRRIYAGIAAFCLIAGGILCLLMGQIIHSTLPLRTVQGYFLVFLASSVANYLTFSDRVILFAEQKNRISALATLASEFLFRIGGLVAAWLMGSYVYYLLFLIGEKLFGNLVCRMYVRRSWPGGAWSFRRRTDAGLRRQITQTVKPLFVSQLATVLQNSSQSILISMLLGSLVVVGHYGNYQMVVSSVGLLYSQIGAAFTSSFGNLATEKQQARMYNAYQRTVTLMSILTIVICAGFLVCIQDFIAMVFGPGFLLSNEAVWILTATMFVTLVNIPVVSVQNAMGLHRCDAHLMVLQAVLAVALGYLGGRYWGIEGILLGMLLPLIALTTVWKGILVLRLAFGSAWQEHVACMLRLAGKGALACGVCGAVCSAIGTGSLLLDILLKGCMAILLSLIIFHFTSLGNTWYNNLLGSVRKRLAALYRKFVRKGAADA